MAVIRELLMPKEGIPISFTKSLYVYLYTANVRRWFQICPR